MFPTSVEQHYQQRNRRRGRNDPNNRDYICPCGKSYLSYPALFTHIKTKHNGRAPGQIIKPTPQNSRRGRPKAREIYDSESETEDIASNSLDRLIDFVLNISENDGESNRLKEIYMKDKFYEIYASFNQQEQESKYNDAEDIFEDTCQNVLSQFLAQVQKKINQPYFVDLIFLFATMMGRGITDNGANLHKIKQEPIGRIVDYCNTFLLQTLPQFKQSQNLKDIQMFNQKNMAKLLQFFYNWLTQKKYLSVKVKINQGFAFEE